MDPEDPEARMLRPNPRKRKLPSCYDKDAALRDDAEGFADNACLSNYMMTGETDDIQERLQEGRGEALESAERMVRTLKGGPPTCTSGLAFVEWHKGALTEVRQTATAFADVLRVCEALARRYDEEKSCKVEWDTRADIVCPASGRVMVNPVLAPDGRIVDRKVLGTRAKAATHRETKALVEVHYAHAARVLAYREDAFAPVCARMKATAAVVLKAGADEPHEAGEWRAAYNKVLSMLHKIDTSFPFMPLRKAVQRLPDKVASLLELATTLYHTAVVREAVESARTFACVLSQQPGDMVFMDGYVYKRDVLIDKVRRDNRAFDMFCTVEEVEDRRFHAPSMERLVCPISRAFARDPVIMRDGIIYERAFIEQHLKKGRHSVIDRSFKLCLCDVERAPTPSYLVDLDPAVEAGAAAILNRWRALP